MNDDELKLPGFVNRFVAARKESGGISAVLLYGSYARGTQHEQSDVDIIFVVDEGFRSEIIVHEGVEFEVLEATKCNMYSYWKKNWDEDRHWYLWKDVIVVFDRDGEGAEIVKHARSLVSMRSPCLQVEIEGRRKIVLAKLERIQHLSQTDPGTASMLLVEYVRELTENWFRIRGQFVPSTKDFLTFYSQECPEYGALLVDFYSSEFELRARFILVKK